MAEIVGMFHSYHGNVRGVNSISRMQKKIKTRDLSAKQHMDLSRATSTARIPMVGLVFLSPNPQVETDGMWGTVYDESGLPSIIGSEGCL